MVDSRVLVAPERQDIPKERPLDSSRHGARMGPNTTSMPAAIVLAAGDHKSIRHAAILALVAEHRPRPDARALVPAVADAAGVPQGL